MGASISGAEAGLILQFGTSRFLQAHVDLILHEARQEGQQVPDVVVVQTSGSAARAGRLAAFAEPDGFPVIVRGLEDGAPVERRTMVQSVDATGALAPIERGFGFIAHGGRYVLLSVVRQDIRFSDPEFHKREASLIASRNAQADDFAEVVRQIEAGRVPTRALNTHRGRLEDGVELFVDWSRPDAGVIKAILEV